MLLKVGCSGFPVNQREYASWFRVVEVQQTFYQPPLRKTAWRWRETMPPDFEFVLKAWQLITHPATSPTYRRLNRPLTLAERGQAGFFQDTPLVREAWHLTRELALVLGTRVILFQCPASFTPALAHLQNLRQFFRTISREEFIYAWEPRGDWPRELVMELCEELGLIPAVDPLVTPPYPQKPAYFRLHGMGSYRYNYSDPELARLAELLKGYTEAYVFFNNSNMWENARRFLTRWTEGPQFSWGSS
uniref:DUF72 domain-containing protein n=1 Tax=Desulfobacca acetoxidans TaxID=60893 RepID=A0A7C5ALC9_9BACT